jgi:hypothetical protein
VSLDHRRRPWRSGNRRHGKVRETVGLPGTGLSESRSTGFSRSRSTICGRRGNSEPHHPFRSWVYRSARTTSGSWRSTSFTSKRTCRPAGRSQHWSHPAFLDTSNRPIYLRSNSPPGQTRRSMPANWQSLTRSSERSSAAGRNNSVRRDWGRRHRAKPAQALSYPQVTLPRGRFAVTIPHYDP